jgi:hypothetical protein
MAHPPHPALMQLKMRSAMSTSFGLGALSGRTGRALGKERRCHKASLGEAHRPPRKCPRPPQKPLIISVKAKVRFRIARHTSPVGHPFKAEFHMNAISFRGDRSAMKELLSKMKRAEGGRLTVAQSEAIASSTLSYPNKMPHEVTRRCSVDRLSGPQRRDPA